MATMKNAKDLISLERRYWQAIKDKDWDMALELTDEPCIIAGAQGVASVSRDTMRDMMEQSTYDLEAFKLSENDAKVRFVGDDVAIVAYQVHEDLVVGGEKLGLDAAECSTWVRRDGQWFCAMHTESLTGDPFGRDRTRS